MRRLVLMLAALLGTAGAQEPEEVPDASAAFNARQRDLVTLAGHLGALHRFRQVCGPARNQDLFRNRMRELVPLEAPMNSTREAMIARFNERYRMVTDDHLSCGSQTDRLYRDEAQRALALTERLREPVPMPQNGGN